MRSLDKTKVCLVVDRRRRLTRRLFSCRECPTKCTFSFQKQPSTEMFPSDLEIKSNSCTLLKILLFLLAALQIKCALRRKMCKVRGKVQNYPHFFFRFIYTKLGVENVCHFST
jgi:hypothetical protein